MECQLFLKAEECRFFNLLILPRYVLVISVPEVTNFEDRVKSEYISTRQDFCYGNSWIAERRRGLKGKGKGRDRLIISVMSRLR